MVAAAVAIAISVVAVAMAAVVTALVVNRLNKLSEIYCSCL